MFWNIILLRMKYKWRRCKNECENDIDDVYEKCENLKDYYFFLIEKRFNGNSNEYYITFPHLI